MNQPTYATPQVGCKRFDCAHQVENLKEVGAARKTGLSPTTNMATSPWKRGDVSNNEGGLSKVSWTSRFHHMETVIFKEPSLVIQARNAPKTESTPGMERGQARILLPNGRGTKEFQWWVDRGFLK